MSIEAMKQALEALDYDAETGELFWNDKAAPKVKNKPAIAKNYQGYIYLKVRGKMILGHRIAWFKHYGSFPIGVIDHINGNILDNRIANLRDIPQSVNMQNQRKAMVDNKTGLLGVSQKGKKYRAQITINQVKKYLGYFDTPELAHQAYLIAKRNLHQGCTL
jgi:uncharacterized Fe-S cluster-containing protein